MRQIYIKYDPYEMTTEFEVNGIPIGEMKNRHPWLDKVLAEKSGIPLQSWIDPVPSQGWDGLLAYLGEMSDDTFSISFCGRRTDFEDLKEALAAQKQSLGKVIHLKYPKEEQRFIKSDAEMKAAIDQVVATMSKDRFKSMVAGSENEALKKKYLSMKADIAAVEDRDFRVVFTGVSDGGKSTVINALVGKNILPQAHGTCTDKVCYVKHSREVRFSKVVYLMADGKAQEKLCADAEETQALIRAASDLEGVDRVEVYVDMSHLCPEELKDQIRLVLVDTPGTGSAAGDDVGRRGEGNTHTALVKNVLSSDEKEMVVLVSGPKADSDEITELLDIFEDMADSGAGADSGCYNNRFLFVLNQCDDKSYNSSQKDMMTHRLQGLENEVYKFKETLAKKAHGAETRNIADPRVFPLTAGAALTIRVGCDDAEKKPKRDTEAWAYYKAYKQFLENLTGLEVSDLAEGKKIDESDVSENYLLDRYSDLSEAHKRKLRQQYDHPENVRDYLLLHTGLLSLELAIRTYIEKYAFPIKMRKLLGAFRSILEEVNEENRSYLEDLEAARADLEDTQKKISTEKETKDKDLGRRQELEDARKEMEEILERVGAIDTSVPEMNTIWTRYLRLQEESADFFEKDPKGGLVRDITVQRAEEIQEKIQGQVGKLADQAKDLVWTVRQKKYETVVHCAREFKTYLVGLREKGLLNAGSFDIQRTVAYQDIVGDGGFMESLSFVRRIANPDKEHIETDDGVLNFFASIGRSLTTIFEPFKIARVDAIRYREVLFASLDGNITRLIKDVESSYQKDIEWIKSAMSKKMRAVLNLITKIDEEIDDRNEKIKKEIETEESYQKRKARLEEDCEFLLGLVQNLNSLEQGGERDGL